MATQIPERPGSFREFVAAATDPLAGADISVTEFKYRYSAGQARRVSFAGRLRRGLRASASTGRDACGLATTCVALHACSPPPLHSCCFVPFRRPTSCGARACLARPRPPSLWAASTRRACPPWTSAISTQPRRARAAGPGPSLCGARQRAAWATGWCVGVARLHRGRDERGGRPRRGRCCPGPPPHLDRCTCATWSAVARAPSPGRFPLSASSRCGGNGHPASSGMRLDAGPLLPSLTAMVAQLLPWMSPSLPPA